MNNPKRNRLRVRSVILLLVVLLSLTATSCTEKTVEITLQPGDTYYFEDHMPLGDDPVFEAGDDTIAEVVSGQ